VNATEQKAKDLLEKLGWRVLRNGWPDFLCESDAGKGYCKVVGVEIKSPSDRLSSEQQLMHSALLRIGIPIFTLCPDHITELEVEKRPIVQLETRQAVHVSITHIEARLRDAKTLANQLEFELQQAKTYYEQVAFLFNHAERMR
jgi:hypothetical protein